MHLVLAAEQLARVEAAGVRTTLAATLREAAMADLFRERELRRLLERLAAAGVNALLLKGAGLAYTVYPAPHLRPRGDVDLLIARADLEAADRALLAGGWLRAVEQTTSRSRRSATMCSGSAASFAEHLDLHWKIAVPHVFGDALDVRGAGVASRADHGARS